MNIKIFFVLIIMIISFESRADRLYKSDLVILVESSIAVPIKEMVKEYIKKNYVNAIINFVEHNNLSESLSDADLLITANEDALMKFAKNKHIEDLNPSDLFNDHIFLYIDQDSSLRFRINPNATIKEILDAVAKEAYLVLSDKDRTILGMLSEKLIAKMGITKVLYVENEHTAANLITKGKTAGILQASYVEYCCKGQLIPILDLTEEGFGSISYKVIAGDSEGANALLRFLLINKSLLQIYG